MKLCLTAFLSSLILLFSSQSIADNPLIDRDVSQQIDRVAKGIMLAKERAEIKRQEELLTHMKSGTSPLSALSKRGLREFRNGLVFGEDGLVGMYYKPLIDELNEKQIYEVLKLFGVQFESHLVSPAVFDSEDSLTFDLMGCIVYGNGEEKSSLQANLSCGSGRDGLRNQICVDFSDGRRCAYAMYSHCFVNC